MAKYKQGKSNQKLYFAKIHIDAIKDAEANDTLLNKKAVIAAFRESSLFHLVSAYHAFLNEMLNTYDVVLSPMDSLADIQAQLTSQGRPSSELERFQQLESSGWLTDLLSAWDEVQNHALEKKPSTLKAAVSGAIDVLQAEPVNEVVQLELWRNKLASEIDALRSLLTEW